MLAPRLGTRMAAEPGVSIPRWDKPGKENRDGFWLRCSCHHSWGSDPGSQGNPIRSRCCASIDPVAANACLDRLPLMPLGRSITLELWPDRSMIIVANGVRRLISSQRFGVLRAEDSAGQMIDSIKSGRQGRNLSLLSGSEWWSMPEAALRLGRVSVATVRGE